MKTCSELEMFLRDNGHEFSLAYGCFDILHVGHVRFLQACKRLSALPLCVGILPDFIVAAKGPDRPLVCAKQRIEVVAALKAVDFAFELTASDKIADLMKQYNLSEAELPLWSTALCWLDVLRPHTFFYSSDFAMNEKIRYFFQDRNIHSVVVPYTEGVSTSDIVSRYKVR